MSPEAVILLGVAAAAVVTLGLVTGLLLFAKDRNAALGAWALVAGSVRQRRTARSKTQRTCAS